MKKPTKSELEQLKGAGKMLDILWGNSYYSMGQLASRRIESEMVYYFGKNWAIDMYKLIGNQNSGIRQLKDFKTTKK